MKKLATFLLTLLLLNLLMLAGLVGFLLATGRLDAAKSRAILALLRHPGSPSGLVIKVEEILQPSATASSTQPASTLPALPLRDSSTSFAASASDRLEYARLAIEQERLRLDREAQDLLQRQKLLEIQAEKIENRLKQIEKEQKNFENSVENHQKTLQSAAFTRTLAYYADLKPKQVKDLFLALPPDAVADYLQALPPDHATKIIAEFKSPDERQYIVAILEKIRTPGTAPASDAAATSP